MSQSINLNDNRFVFRIRKISVEQATQMFQVNNSFKRLLGDELSGIESIRDVFLVETVVLDSMELLGTQLKSIFVDLGFRVDLIFGKKRGASFDGVLNIDGFSIPGWERVANLLPHRVRRRLLLSYSPGKSRLHIRAYELSPTIWLVVAHTDNNWISFNLKSIYLSHFGYGAGDYVRGTELLDNLLQSQVLLDYRV